MRVQGKLCGGASSRQSPVLADGRHDVSGWQCQQVGFSGISDSSCRQGNDIIHQKRRSEWYSGRLRSLPLGDHGQGFQRNRDRQRVVHAPSDDLVNVFAEYGGEPNGNCKQWPDCRAMDARVRRGVVFRGCCSIFRRLMQGYSSVHLHNHQCHSSGLNPMLTSNPPKSAQGQSQQRDSNP
jgi:hypothetical protein